MTNYTKITDNDLAAGALYDKVNDMADALNADKLERTAAGVRKANTAYISGNLVICEYHPELMLKCTTAGTTAVGALDTSGSLSLGSTITDGSVVWTAVSVNSIASGTDVNLTSLADGDLLKYDNTTGKWVNTKTLTNNYTFSGTNTFSTSTGLQAKEPVMTPQNNDLEGGDIIFKGATNDPLVNYDFHVDRHNGNMRIWGYDSNGNTIVPFTVDMRNNRVLTPGYNAMPNYSTSVAISNTGSFTATSNGYAFFTLHGGGNETHAYVNGVDVAIGWYTNTGVGQRTCVPMKNGDVLTWDTGRISNPIFVKCIGG